MNIHRAACLGFVGLIGLSCSMGGPGEGQFPTEPAPVVTPPPLPPPPPLGAQRIAVGQKIVDELSSPPSVPATCPEDNPVTGPLPCRHFEVVAPAAGVLAVEFTWESSFPDGTIGVIVAGVQQPLRHAFLQVANHRVVAGATYGITVFWYPSHSDHDWGGGAALGKFTLTTKMQ